MLSPLAFNPVNSYSRSKAAIAANKNVSFGINTEYERVKALKLSSDIRTSNYFRMYGGFEGIINALKLVYGRIPRPKILIVGVGRAQEPFSILAVIKNMFKGKPIESSVDLNCVDLQPKISGEKLKEYSILDSWNTPDLAPEAFEQFRKNENTRFESYRIKSELVRYLGDVFNDPNKTKWDTKIQDFSAACADNTYDVVSMNNVLDYITDSEKEMVIKNLGRMIKPNGILVTDAIYASYVSRLLRSNFMLIEKGVWQKAA